MRDQITNRIRIWRKNPNDPADGVIAELAAAIRTELPEYEVQLTNQDVLDGRRQVTFAIICHVILEHIGDAALGSVSAKVLKAGVTWAKARFFCNPEGLKRPVYISIYGPDGKIVKSVAVKDKVSEPIDRTGEELTKIHRG